ncbi:Ig-like domain repeat protein [Streptomyces tubercidicus]|uniref:Ig-like domain repeat protein n=1 Tax=Streptomyces tubercidicus TaxID=47759 RepID=UPI0030E1D9EF
MLTPESPYGLVILTDCQGNCIALVDPMSHRVVPFLGAPAPLAVRDDVGGPVVRTVVDGAATLLGALAGVRNRLASAPSWGRLDTVATRPGRLAERNQFSGVFPDQGSTGGGTLVTIIGRNFTRATAVSFGPRPAASFAVLDDRTVVAVTPSCQGSVPITVTTPGGSARVGYFFYLPWPSLAGIAPATGPIGGGNTVILTGANLSTSLRVYFGDAVAFPTVLSDREISVTVPPTTGPGTVPVYVTTLGGVSNRLLYTYATVAHVTGVSPDTGPIAGGTTLVLTGSGLARVTGVTIGGVPVSSFRAFSDSLLVVVTPPGVPGPADIVLTTPGGSVTLPGGFDHKAPSVVTVTSAPDPAPVGQPVTFTATLEGVPSTTGTPSGTVLFDFGDGTAPVTVSLTDGTATVEHAYTGPSDTPYAVTVDYGGDLYFLPATGTDTQAIEAASTTTTVTSGPDPSQVGQPVTFVARVAPTPPGAGAPTGTVTFDFGDGTAPVTMPMAGGSATVTHAYPDAAGLPYPVTATYSGDDNFTDSTGTDSQTVQQAATTTAVDLAPQPSVAGQPVTVTATVAAVPPGVAVPTGTVTFDFGDGTPPVDVPLTDGTAAISHAYAGTAASPYTVTATYPGDGNLEPSTGTGSQSVGPSGSTTTVVSAPDPSTVGEPVTFGATVSALAPGAGTPTGTVTFDFGDGSTPVTAPLTDGTATTGHVYTAAEDNPYTVTATYDGDADFTTSSGTDTQSVQPAGTALAVVSAPDPSTVGEPVTFDVTVSALAPGAGTPTGTVTFDFGDGTPPGTASLTDGAAEITHTYTDAAELPYPVTATYNGDADFTTSLGTDTQTVQPADTTTSVNSAPDPSTVGQLTTFVAQISPEAPAAGAPTGAVTFAFGDGTPPVTAPVEGGTATVTHANPEVAESPYTVAATYSGDDNFNPSAGTDSQLVAPAVPTTTVTSTPAPSVTGETVTFTATVAAAPPAEGTPTGTVTFDFGDGTAPVTAPVTSEVATVTHAYVGTSGSPYTVTADYSGDDDFTSATATGVHTVAVSAATTSTTVSSAPDPAVTGQPVSFTVTVAPTPPGAGVPTGTVTFTFGDGTAAVTAPLSGGIAGVTHVYNTAADSPYTVTVGYSGDANFSSSSGTDSQTVAPASTLTTVTTTPDPSVVGQPVTLTATVAPTAPGAGVPTGAVTFNFGDGTPPTLTSLSDGVARITHTYTSAGGPYTVTADYDGDTGFLPSSGGESQTVGKAATSTAVVSSPDPTVVGQLTTVTASVASVAPGAGAPSGTVTFDFGDGSPTLTAPVGDGLAVVTHAYGGTSGSPFVITGTYGGDANFTSSSGHDTQTVGKAATTTAVASSPDPTVVGQPTTLTASVASATPGAAVPTGTVTFTFGDGTGSTTTTLTGGTATVTHTYATRSGSPFHLTATYNGDSGFTASSGSDSQTVGRAATTTELVSSPDPSVAGQAVTLTATVSAVAPGAGTPTGTVTFSFGDGTSAATTPLSNGTATVTHTFNGASVSPYAVTAIYNGDGNFTASSGSDTQTVGKVATTTELVSSPDPSVAGQAVALTATVASTVPGAGTPTGSVTFGFGDGTSAGTATLSGGIATVTHTYASRSGSPFALTAAYNGDATFSASTGTDTQTLSKNVSTTTVTSTPDPSASGGAVTIRATVSSPAGTPTGTVTFSFGDGTGTATGTLSGGVATVTHAYTTTTGSPFTVTATYGGDAGFTGSTGSDTQTVTRSATSTTVVSTPNPSGTGDRVTVTATVVPVAPGTGTPTGTVTLALPGRTPQTVPLVGGQAGVSFTPLPKGLYLVTGNYNGDVSFAPSTGTTSQLVV